MERRMNGRRKRRRVNRMRRDSGRRRRDTARRDLRERSRRINKIIIETRDGISPMTRSGGLFKRIKSRSIRRSESSIYISFYCCWSLKKRRINRRSRKIKIIIPVVGVWVGWDWWGRERERIRGRESRRGNAVERERRVKRRRERRVRGRRKRSEMRRGHRRGTECRKIKRRV